MTAPADIPSQEEGRGGSLAPPPRLQPLLPSQLYARLMGEAHWTDDRWMVGHTTPSMLLWEADVYAGMRLFSGVATWGLPHY